MASVISLHGDDLGELRSHSLYACRKPV